MLATARAVLDLLVKSFSVLALLAVAYFSFAPRPSQRSQTTLVSTSPANANVKAELRVERFQDMGYGRHVWARLSQRDPRSGGSFSKVAGTVAHNYLIYDPISSSSWRLHKHDADLLVDVTILRGEGMAATFPNQNGPSYSGTTAQRNDTATRAVAFGVIESDTNGDGQIAPDDARTLHVADADGRNAQQADVTYDELLGVSMVGDQLLAILGSRGTVEAVHIDLATKKVTRRHKM